MRRTEAMASVVPTGECPFLGEKLTEVTCQVTDVRQAFVNRRIVNHQEQIKCG